MIAERTNHLMVAGLLVIVGTLMVIFGGPGQDATTPVDRQPSGDPGPSSADEPSCERDLSLDAYRLWLASKYNITRNDVFDRFVLENTTFTSLDQALSHAHANEMVALEAQAEEQRRYEAEDAEWAAGAQQRAVERAEIERVSKRQTQIGFVYLVLLVIAIMVLSSSFRT